MRLFRVLPCVAILSALAAVGCLRQPRFTIPDEALLPIDRSSLPAAASSEVTPEVAALSTGDLAAALSMDGAQSLNAYSHLILAEPLFVIPRSNAYKKVPGAYGGYTWRMNEESVNVGLDIGMMYFTIEDNSGAFTGEARLFPIMAGPRLIWTLPWYKIQFYVGGGGGHIFVGDENPQINPTGIQHNDTWMAYFRAGSSYPIWKNVSVGADFFYMFIKNDYRFPPPGTIQMPELDSYAIGAYVQIEL
jgi:hypothetical protein